MSDMMIEPSEQQMLKYPTWYKDAVFYELHLRAFKDSNGDGIGDFRGAMETLPYLQWLGVDCIWLLPMYPSPLVDDGYDISDYYSIHPDLGTPDDFKAFVSEAHRLGMRVITDLILNHTSDQHEWFQASRRREEPYTDWYVWSDSDQLYKEVRIIFLDHQPSNWAWDEERGQYFWHRFYAEQPDLNFDNPQVREAMKDIIRFWLRLGLDGFRADAIPYLIEREGTSGENLPETHVYLKEVRQMIDSEFPGRILLGEANMWPEDVRPYFGEDDDPELQMGFHFPVMPRVYKALKMQQAEPIISIMERTPDIPQEAQWVTFLRNHDELTLEMVSEEDRQWMWEQYAPEPHMRLNLGIRRRLAPLLDNNRRKIELANSILFTLPGSPIIYYGDEIGMGDNIWLPDRHGVRTPMQWDNKPLSGLFRRGAGQVLQPDHRRGRVRAVGDQRRGAARRPHLAALDDAPHDRHAQDASGARARQPSLPCRWKTRTSSPWCASTPARPCWGCTTYPSCPKPLPCRWRISRVISPSTCSATSFTLPLAPSRIALNCLPLPIAG